MKAYLEGRDLILQYETPLEQQRLQKFFSYIMSDRPVIGGEIILGQGEDGQTKRGLYLEVVLGADQLKQTGSA